MTSIGPDPQAHAPQPQQGPPAPPQGPAPQASVPQPPAVPQPPNWAWAQQPRPTQVVESEPLEYHRLLRGVAGYRWWKPLLLLVLAGVYFGVFTVVVTLLMLPVIAIFDPNYATDVATGATEVLDTQRPVSVLVALLSIIIMIPSVLLAMLSLGMRPVGRVWSVAARVRWGLLGRLFGVAVLSVVVMNAVGIAAGMVLDPAAATQPVEASANEFSTSAMLVSLVLIILLVPLQSVAEEMVFRGLFMQVIGSWLKNPWFAILIPTVGFALLHIYDPWGLAAVGMLGAVAAWLTWRTGGLEAGMAIHVANNVIVFCLMASGFGGQTAQTSESGGPAGLIGEIAGLALFAWLTLKIFSGGRHGRTRIDLIRVPVAAEPGTPVPVAPVPAAPAPAAPVPPAPAGSSAPVPPAQTAPPASTQEDHDV